MPKMKHYDVVAAVVCSNGKYLCMQKGKTKFAYTSYKWEFPGGKIEQNETPQQALERELMEEMDYPVYVEKKIIAVEHIYPDFSITMAAFLCSPRSDKFTMKEHVGYKWIDAEALHTLDWAEADVEIVNAIQKCKEII